MKERIYTLLKVESDYGLSVLEKMFWQAVDGITHEAYIRNLIELRDAGYIHEDNDGNSIIYRNRYLTEKGRKYLSELKMLYLRELSLRCLKWNLKHWYVALIAALAAKCCS